MSATSEESYASTEDFEHGPNVQTPEDIARRLCQSTSKCCTTVCILCICVLLSFFTSLVTTSYLLNTSFPRTDTIKEGCVVCYTRDLDRNQSEGVQCCDMVKYGNSIPVS